MRAPSLALIEAAKEHGKRRGGPKEARERGLLAAVISTGGQGSKVIYHIHTTQLRPVQKARIHPYPSRGPPPRCQPHFTGRCDSAMRPGKKSPPHHLPVVLQLCIVLNRFAASASTHRRRGLHIPGQALSWRRGPGIPVSQDGHVGT